MVFAIARPNVNRRKRAAHSGRPKSGRKRLRRPKRTMPAHQSPTQGPFCKLDASPSLTGSPSAARNLQPEDHGPRQSNVAFCVHMRSLRVCEQTCCETFRVFSVSAERTSVFRSVRISSRYTSSICAHAHSLIGVVSKSFGEHPHHSVMARSNSSNIHRAMRQFFESEKRRRDSVRTAPEWPNLRG